MYDYRRYRGAPPAEYQYLTALLAFQRRHTTVGDVLFIHCLLPWLLLLRASLLEGQGCQLVSNGLQLWLHGLGVKLSQFFRADCPSCSPSTPFLLLRDHGGLIAALRLLHRLMQ